MSDWYNNYDTFRNGSSSVNSCGCDASVHDDRTSFVHIEASNCQACPHWKRYKAEKEKAKTKCPSDLGTDLEVRPTRKIML